MKMYLMIFEDGTIRKSSAYSDSEINACDDGYMDLIDISNPEHLLTYYDSSWISVEDV